MSEAFTRSDEAFMRRALVLARRGAGRVSPNPLVGAVLVKDGRIVGEGWHRRYGGKHAETEAVEAAGGEAAGAVLYCTLEPCCFRAPSKHQPPCTELIIQSRISRVVVANRDPHPLVDGEGLRQLRAAGISIASGLLAAEGERLNEGFFTSQRTGLPFVHLKLAQSLDGRIAAAGGDSRWITDEKARRLAHRLRAGHDAVLVGVGTVRSDDPLLTVRSVRGRNPLRLVLDSRLSIPDGARLLGLPDRDRTIIMHAAPPDSERLALLGARGVRLVRVAADPAGRVEARAALAAMTGLGIRSLLVEGGAGVFTSFVRERLYDRISIFIAPILIGAGVPSLDELGVRLVRDSRRLTGLRTRRIGDQLLVEGCREAVHVHGNH